MDSDVSRVFKLAGDYLKSHTKDVSNGIEIITETDIASKWVQAVARKQDEEES